MQFFSFFLVAWVDEEEEEEEEITRSQQLAGSTVNKRKEGIKNRP